MRRLVEISSFSAVERDCARTISCRFSRYNDSNPNGSWGKLSRAKGLSISKSLRSPRFAEEAKGDGITYCEGRSKIS